MGDLDFTVRIKTGYQDPTSLMEALGRSVARGCFRVPARLSAGRPFVLVLTTRLGAAAVKGTAEVVGHEGSATWVRFLSATDPRNDADTVLDGVEVAVSPPEALTQQMRAPDFEGASAGERADERADERGAAPRPSAGQRDSTTARRSAVLAHGSQSPPAGSLAAIPPPPVIDATGAPSATGTGRSPALARPTRR